MINILRYKNKLKSTATLTCTITVVRSEVLVARRDFVLDEADDVREREGSPTRSAREGVRWHAGSGRPSALCRAVRIRWGEEDFIKHIACVFISTNNTLQKHF